jgi:hypothetical protein
MTKEQLERKLATGLAANKIVGDRLTCKLDKNVQKTVDLQNVVIENLGKDSALLKELIIVIEAENTDLNKIVEHIQTKTSKKE